TNYFYPQQKLVSKVRAGAKVSKKHDNATTPFHRAIDHPTMTVERIVALTRTYSLINPAATQRQIHALTAQLLTLVTSKAAPDAAAPINKRARLREATNQPSRASCREATGRHRRAARMVARTTSSPALAWACATRAVLATGDEAEQLYAEALCAAPTDWPFQSAFAQVAYVESYRAGECTTDERGCHDFRGALAFAAAA